MGYADALQHPLWQRKRLECFERAHWTCQRCGATGKPLHAHHLLYLPRRKPWEYLDGQIVCLCETCHKLTHDERQDFDIVMATLPMPLHPRLLVLFADIGRAAINGSGDALTHARNRLQDLIDESIDFARGAGG